MNHYIKKLKEVYSGEFFVGGGGVLFIKSEYSFIAIFIIFSKHHK